MPESANSETRSSSIITAHRRRPHPVVLISRAIHTEPSPFAEWSPDWRWIELTTPGEIVCQRIAADFDQASSVVEQLPIPALWRDPAPRMIDRRGAVA